MVADRMFLSYAKDPKVAIKQIMNDEKFNTEGLKFDDFRAKSVGNLVANYGNVMEFTIVDEEEKDE